MEHIVDRALHVDVLGHIVTDELKIPIAEMGDVGQIAGDEIVDANHRVAAAEELFAEV